MRLAIIVPCFNEEASIREIVPPLMRLAGPHDILCFVDDGSTDLTVRYLREFQWQARNGQPSVVWVERLLANHGHQYALLRGLLLVKGRCDAAMTMDADGQHPPSAIPDFIGAYNQGADIVYGVRRRNPRWTSRIFYRLMGDALVANHGDFRLISANVLDTLTENSEPFLRGLFSPANIDSHLSTSLNYFAQMNLKTAIVYYDEQPRIAGKSSYTLRKRVGLFWQALRWRIYLP